MRIDLADNIKLGDIVYNCFMDELVITTINKHIDSKKIFFGTIDTRLRRASYDSNNVYLKNLEDEADDEKAWVNWAKDNRDFFDEFDHIETMKEVYKIAFYNGFEYKRQTIFQEQMQK
jgi:hypothetical protein